jgi:hypothetical protein
VNDFSALSPSEIEYLTDSTAKYGRKVDELQALSHQDPVEA